MCVPKLLLCSQVCILREGKIHQNIPLSLRTSIKGKAESFVQSTSFLMLPHRAELEGKSLYLGIDKVKGMVGKLMSVAREDSKSLMRTQRQSSAVRR